MIAMTVVVKVSVETANNIVVNVTGSNVELTQFIRVVIDLTVNSWKHHKDS